jgi:predicted dehydrogenase
MYRIGIIGSENSHAMAFSKIFNTENTYPDMRVVAVGGDWPEESEKVKAECRVGFVAEKPSDMLGNVDAVMVTARHGGWHAEFARPFIEAGIPTFIDKPFTVDPYEAVNLAKLARDKKVPLVGGSSTKDVYDVLTLQNLVKTGGCLGGTVNAPLNMENPYGGFFFYSSHLAEIMLTVFGYGPESVDAHEAGGSVTATAHYDEFDVTNHFVNGTGYYSAAVFTKTRPVLREIDISMCYRHECEAFARMLRTGEMNHSYEELVYPVFYLNAVYEACKTGVRQKLPGIGEVLA